MLSIYTQIILSTLEPSFLALTRTQVPFYKPLRHTRRSSQHIFQPRIDVVVRSRIPHVQGIRDEPVLSCQSF